MWNKLLQFIDNRLMYVIVDGADNSVTLSKRLTKSMKLMEQTQAKVFVFRIPESASYGFMLNPNIEQETQISEVQYNDKYKSIGFESLCPTVNRILYDYGLPSIKCRLSVKRCKTVAGQVYYKMCKPYGESAR